MTFPQQSDDKMQILKIYNLNLIKCFVAKWFVDIFKSVDSLEKHNVLECLLFFVRFDYFVLNGFDFVVTEMKDQENYSNFQTVCYKRFENRMQTTTE